MWAMSYGSSTIAFKNPTHHCADNTRRLFSARLELKLVRFSIKNLAHHEAGLYLTMVQMAQHIAINRQESFMSHAVTGSGDHPDSEPQVYDGLIQMHVAMKQLYAWNLYAWKRIEKP